MHCNITPEQKRFLATICQTMGLHTSWPKTHLQNAGYGTQPCAVTIQGHTVDVTDRFTYLGSEISSCGRSTPETLKRIGFASSVMGQLTSVWRQSRLSLHTKLRMYNVLVVSVLLYGAETWTLTKSDECKLEAFQMSCMRRILGIRWFNFVSNASVMDQVKQRPICSRIRDRRITCLDMYAVYKSLFPRTRHFVWQSKPVQASDLTTGWTGSVRVAVLDIRGSASWRSTSGLLQLPPGIWPVIVKSGGRNDPSPVKRSSE